MTSDRAGFRWVEIEGFRGFNLKQRIELDASAVLIHGPNGTGKTSFFDALQWLLIGSLQRLEKWRVRKNDEHITNLYAGSAPAVVRAEIQLGGQVVELRRQGRHNEGFLEWTGDDAACEGEEAERLLRQALTSRPGQDVRRLLMTSALLQQDEVREVLEDKPAERYQQLAAMLGLDELAGFENAAKKRADRLTAAARQARTALETAQGKADGLKRRADALEAQVRLTDDVRAAREEILTRMRSLAPTVRVLQEPSTSADAAMLQQAADSTGRRLAELQQRQAQLRERRSAAVTPDEKEARRRQALVAAAQVGVDQAQALVSAAARRLAEASDRSERLAALAAQAIDLLGPTCPVCGQSIDAHDVREELQQRINRGSDDELAAAVKETDDARTLLARAREELELRQKELAPFFTALRESEELARDERQWEDEAAAFSLPEASPIELVTLSPIRAGQADAFSQTIAALRAVSTAASELVAVLGSDRSDRQLAELRSQQRRADELLQGLKDAVHLASQQEDEGRRLWRAATAAVAAVTERRFKSLAPTVQDIFLRLDPHPSLTRLDFDLDIYYNRGIASPVVTDALLPEIKGDPLLVFSSSQANVTALSYFLAVGWAAGPDALPFVLLDDPLQSMDDVNALGFADLCRYMRQHRQLVVSTHEHRFASLLQRKLTPRQATERTRVIEFKAWTRDGPVIEQKLLESQLAEGRDRSIVPSAAA